MFAPILLALLIVPLVELYVIMQVGDVLGVVPTILLLIAVSIAGTWLLKREGGATWVRLRETLARGQMPASEAIDGALILFAGALLLTPGFLTDFVGLLLILPPSRAAIRRSARRFFAKRAAARLGASGMVGRSVVDATIRRSSRRPGSPRGDAPRTDPSEAPPSPSSLRRGDEDGSPGTG